MPKANAPNVAADPKGALGIALKPCLGVVEGAVTALLSPGAFGNCLLGEADAVVLTAALCGTPEADAVLLNRLLGRAPEPCLLAAAELTAPKPEAKPKGGRACDPAADPPPNTPVLPWEDAAAAVLAAAGCPNRPLD